jgi:acyl-CoA thioester hydrolase
MQNGFETYRGIVYPWHIDHVGHLNVQHYVGRFDEASWHFLFHLGLEVRDMDEHHRSLVALDQRVKYVREVRVGALLHVRSSLLSFGNKTLSYRHVMYEGENESASMDLVVAYFDTAARKAVPLPQRTRELAKAMLEPAE